jgi:hypothetical protein
VLRDDRGWNGPAPPGVVFHYRPGRKGEYAAEILKGFNGTIQVDAYGAYTHLATPKRPGGDPLRLAFCWSHGRRKLIKAKPKKGSPIVDEALLRIAALYKIEDAIRGADPDHRRTVRQELSRPLVDEFFTWLAAQAARVSRKSDLGEAMRAALALVWVFDLSLWEPLDPAEGMVHQCGMRTKQLQIDQRPGPRCRSLDRDFLNCARRGVVGPGS